MATLLFTLYVSIAVRLMRVFDDDLSLPIRLLQMSVLLLIGGAWGSLNTASAQHPTEVTSIVNSNADTTLEVNYNGSLLMSGEVKGVVFDAPSDSIPTEGAGTRLMWYPAKAAFRAGRVFDNSGPLGVDGTQFWNASNIGRNSMALGRNTKASSINAVALGSGTTASGPGAMAMGISTIAGGSGAVAMGQETKAKGDNATAMGGVTVAETGYSVSMGVCNSANTTQNGDGTLFVVGNGNADINTCTARSDALVLDQSGNLSIDGVFEGGPTGNTYAGQFQGSKNATDTDTTSYVAMIDNTNTGSDADGLAIQTGPDTDPGVDNNFITFFEGDGEALGAIEGDFEGGVSYSSSGADFAEELPVTDGAEAPDAGELVGVRDGTVSLQSNGADRIMIASTAPIMTGNTTPATQADDNRRVAVAFVGQVPAKVRGPVQVNDLIVASGKDDGTGRAVPPSEYRRLKHGPIAGQAWSAKSSEGIGEVTVAVGLGRSGAMAKRLQAQQQQITALKNRVQKLEDLQKRVAQLEARSGGAVWAGLSGSGLWVGLLLGGLLGAGLFWRHRM